jgi:ectoine hydroxylase-related dioxygenase (phytanoyl-CoA dioxygenase family)
MLSRDDFASYRRDGFVVARSVLSPAEIATLHQDAERIWLDAERDSERPGLHWRRHETLGRSADRLEPVYPNSEAFAAVADDSRMITLATEALATPSAFFKDKLIMKAPGTCGHALHHDYAYWMGLGVAAEEFVSLFVALDASDASNGGLDLFPGLHLRKLLPHHEDPFDIDPSAVEEYQSHIPALAAGDVLVFHSLLPHRSAPNHSVKPCRSYVVTYMHARHAGRVNANDPARRKVVYRALTRGGV